MKTKICSICGVDKPHSEYHVRKDRKVGIKPSCKECWSKYREERYRKEKENDPINLWLRGIIANTKYRANKDNTHFNITKENLINKLDNSKCCVYCDNKLNFQNNIENRHTSPTLDKIIPNLGYTDNNVVIACYRCNAIKNNATFDELRNISIVLENLIKDRNLLVP